MIPRRAASATASSSDTSTNPSGPEQQFPHIVHENRSPASAGGNGSNQSEGPASGDGTGIGRGFSRGSERHSSDVFRLPWPAPPKRRMFHRHDAKIAKTWEVVERNMRNAPGPDLVARQVLRLIQSGEPPPRVSVGNAFESKIAPLIFRFLPQRVRIWGLKRYYGI